MWPSGCGSHSFHSNECSDLTEATLAGAWLSIAAAVLMTFLFCAVGHMCKLGYHLCLHMSGLKNILLCLGRIRILGILRTRLQEFLSFMSTASRTELVVDRSPTSELLKINFNIRQAPWKKCCCSLLSSFCLAGLMCCVFQLSNDQPSIYTQGHGTQVWLPVYLQLSCAVM